MAASEWHQQFIVRSAEVVPFALPGVLDQVNEVLKDMESLTCLMADYWNAPGIFRDYATARQEYTNRVADCIGGSAFGSAAEVRWRKINHVFRVVLVAEADGSRLPLLGAGITWRVEHEEIARALRGNDRYERFIQLWGSRHRADGTWVEARIPRPLTYPIVHVQRDSYNHVRLYFVEYRDERGRVIVYRRTRLVAHMQEVNNPQEPRQEEKATYGETTSQP